MTVENKVVFDLAEIGRIVLECNECAARISVKPGTMNYPPDRCPNSHAWNWNRPVSYESTQAPIRALFTALPKLQNTDAKDLGVRVFLELESQNTA